MIDFEKEKKEIWRKNKTQIIPNASGAGPRLNSGSITITEPSAKSKTAQKIASEVKKKNSTQTKKKQEPKTIPRAESKKTSTASKTKRKKAGQLAGQAALTGLSGFNSNLAKTVDFFLPDVITPSFVQEGLDYYKNAAEKESDKLEKLQDTTGKKIAGNLISGGVQMLPNATLALMSGGASIAAQGAPTLAKAGSMAASTLKNPMFVNSMLQSVGPTYEKEISEGTNPVKATASALVGGALGSLVETSGGIEKLNTSNGVLKSILKTAGEEGLEEIEQYTLENLVNKALGSDTSKWLSLDENENAVINPIAQLKGGAYGAALGGLLGGGQQIMLNTLSGGKTKKTAGKPADIPVNDVVKTAQPQDIPRADESSIPQTVPKTVPENNLETIPNAEPIQAMPAESVQRITKAIEKRSGVKVTYQDLPEGIDGIYENGSIIVSSTAKNPAYTVLKHELTHHIESSGNYQALSNFIEDSMRNAGYDVDGALARITEDYARIGRSLSPEQAKKEFVAKFSEEFLFNSEKSIERLARENPGMFRQIYDWIVDTVKKIGASEETKFLIDAQRKYEKALRTVGEASGEGPQLLYAGSRSLMADKGLKQKAIQMQAAGASAEEIWKKTGWRFGKDQKWRYEIDDSKMIFDRKGLAHMLDNKEFMRYREMGRTGDFFNPDYADLDSTYGQEVRRKKTQLSQFIKHKDLFEAYPNLRGTVVEFVDNLTSSDGTKARGLTEGGKIKINSGLSDEQVKTTLLHEIQHIIQKKEEFEHGGDYRSGLEALRKQAIAAIEKGGRYEKELDELTQLRFEDWKDGGNRAAEYIDNFLKKGYNTNDLNEIGKNGYNLLMGEKEAKSVAERRNYDASERILHFPDYDESALVQEDYYTGWRGPSESLGDNPPATVRDDYYGGQNNSSEILADIYETASGQADVQNIRRRVETHTKNQKMGVQHNGKMGTEEKSSNGRSNRHGGRNDTETILGGIENKGLYASGTNLQGTKYTDNLRDTSHHLYGETGNKYMEIPKAGEEPAFYNAQNDVSQAPNTAEPAAPVRGAKKAAAYEKRQQRYFVEKTKEALGVSKYSDNKKIQDMVSAAGEKMKAGGMSQAERDAMFDTMFTDGIVKDYELISRYGDLKSTLRNTALKVTDDIRKNIADFNDFRKGIFGSMRLSNEGGAQVDIFYDELRSMYPELFPELNTPAEMVEQMADVAKSLGVTEKRLMDMEGVDADVLYAEARVKFNEALDELELKANVVKQYISSKNRQTVMSPEESLEYIENIKMMRREIEKISSKILLDEQDSELVNLLLKGKLQPEAIPKFTINSDNVLTMYEAKAKLQNAEAALKQLGADTKAEYRRQAEELLEGSETWDDIIGLLLARETPERVMQDVAGTEKGNAIADQFIKPIHENEAIATRMKTELRRIVKGLNISTKPKYKLGERIIDAPGLAEQLHEMGKSGKNAKLSESMLVQLYGEGFIDEQFITSLGADLGKIQNAVSEMRTLYNQLLDAANQVLIRHGYEPIEYRQDYFPHFSEARPDGAILKLMNKLGMKIVKEELPTDINGLTHTFRPGKRWFANALSRTGIATEYDAIKGFDIYLEGIADVIHHTEDIQKLRALEESVRLRYSDDGVKAEIRDIEDQLMRGEITQEKAEALKNAVYKAGNTKLGSFANWIRNYTDALAGKKSQSDRVIEGILGRGVYNTAKALENRLAANMVAVNPASWLTNFIPLVQAGNLKTSYIIAGMARTITNYIDADDFADMSTFLTNRKGSDVLWKSTAEKWQEILTKPMQLIDNFVSQSLVRAKYLEELDKGVSVSEAIDAADKLAAGVIADRSKGALPNLFNSKNPFSKILTMFQVEVNNQWSYLFKDIPRTADNSAKVALAYANIAIASYIFNDVYEHFVGRRPALDPLSWVNEFVGDATGKEVPNFADALWSAMTEEDYELSFDAEKKGLAGAVAGLKENVTENIPFVGGVFGEGGRVPISSAFPDSTKTGTAWANLASSEGSKKKAIIDLAKEYSKPIAYTALPMGGGQIKKMVESGITYAKQGNYALDNEGNEKLRYSVEQKPGQLIKGMLFGQYAMGTGDEYIESGFKMLSAKKTAAYKAALELGANPTETEALLRSINGNKKTEMRQQIMDSGFTTEQKNAMGAIIEGEDGRRIDYSSPSAFRYSLLSEAQQKKVDALQSAGVNKGKALDIYEVYGKVEGDTQITKVMGMLAEDNYKTTVFNALGISETAVSEAKLLMKYDLTAKDYEKARQYANTNGNSSVSAKEAKAYLDKRSDLSRKEKYALFKALTTVKDENNPYH